MAKIRPGLESITARELRTLTLPPIRWVVHELMGVGLWILAAPPKTGKSWLVLSLLLALTTGGVALGALPVSPMPVLYLALEDNRRRLRSRLDYLDLGLEEWPATFHIVNEAAEVEAGLVDQLEAWLAEHPDVRLIVIDTLARVRGTRNKLDDLYTGDSRFMSQLQQFAMKRDICILVVHHTNKSGGEDPFETISGSYGMTGPADGMLVLKRTRGEADATLHITGRDVEDRNLALRFTGETGEWRLLGDARHYALSAERRQIIETLDTHPGLKPKELADQSGLKHASVKHLLIRMRDEGLLKSDGEGRYTLIHPIHPRVENPSGTQGDGEQSAIRRHSPVHPSGDTVNDGERKAFTQESTSHTQKKTTVNAVNDTPGATFTAPLGDT